MTVSAEEIRRYVGRRVRLTLAPDAAGGPEVIGRLADTLPALDGLVVTIEPEGGGPRTYHYHHIAGIEPA